MLGVNTNKIAGKKDGGVRQNGSPRGNAKKGLKVVYISSPMKVTTSAAEFRATVQELTGCDSNVAQFMDSDDQRYLPNRKEVEVRRRQGEDKARGSDQSIGSCDARYYPNYLESWGSKSPTAESGSTFDDMGVHHRDADVYTSRSFQDSTLLEVIGSFDLA